MTHKSVRLLPKAVDLAAMQDTLPRESHASVPSSSGEHDARALNQGSFLPPLRGSLVLPRVLSPRCDGDANSMSIPPWSQR